MSISELQKYATVSKYSRYVEELGRREVWPETVDRYVEMLCVKYPERGGRIRELRPEIEAYHVMPSMRGLQFGGPPILAKNERLYNCTGSYCDRLRFFQESFFLLLCGCGTGFSVQECHLQSLPRLSLKRRKGVRLPPKTFVVPDTIEGWADAAGVLLSSYHEEPVREFEEYHDCEVQFDLSRIRPKGSPLSYGIGRAPGPKPLNKALESVRGLLGDARGRMERLNSITAYDVTMHLADAVVSGGVRRSATIVVFDLWDRAMMEAKTGNWRATNPQRGRSNNSASCLRGRVRYDEEFRPLFERTRQFGEPGFYWTTHEDIIPNPCVEIGFLPRLMVEGTAPSTLRLQKSYQGPWKRDEFSNNTFFLSGWQFCNLTTIPLKDCRDADEFHHRCGLASELGTWQAGFTSFPYLGWVSEEIARKEALLGVSLSGVMHHPQYMLDPEVLEEGAVIVLKTNEQEAARIGINPTARATCVKPDGNSGSVLGGFSGCHPGKFRRGFRLVQCNKQEPPYQHFKSVNPEACEESVWSTNKTDDVIRFCCEFEGLMEDELTAIEFLEHVRTIQNHWVKPGRVVERCASPHIQHNVSNTVRVREEEWDEVAAHIFKHQEDYGGVSFIGVHGDRDYPQAPFTSVYTPEEQEEMYGLAVDIAPFFLPSKEFNGLWDACDYVLGLWDENRKPTEEQERWGDRFAKFAGVVGDVRKATYCLKDMYNWRLWQKLRASYREVDYSQMREDGSRVELQQEVACAGGACLL